MILHGLEAKLENKNKRGYIIVTKVKVIEIGRGDGIMSKIVSNHEMRSKFY